MGKRLEKFPLISQLASQRSLDDVVPDDDEDPIVNCHPHLSLFSRKFFWSHAEQTEVRKQMFEMLDKIRAFQKQIVASSM